MFVPKLLPSVELKFSPQGRALPAGAHGCSVLSLGPLVATSAGQWLAHLAKWQLDKKALVGLTKQESGPLNTKQPVDATNLPRP